MYEAVHVANAAGFTHASVLWYRYYMLIIGLVFTQFNHLTMLFTKESMYV